MPGNANREQGPAPALPPQAAAPDFTRMDDATLIDTRRDIRDQMLDLPAGSPERVALQAAYDVVTEEFDRRGRAAWSAAMPK